MKRRAAELDGFFGRGQVFIDLGDDDDNALPLAVHPGKIGKGALKGLRVVEPLWTYPNAYNASKPLRRDFYRPSSWYVMGEAVHRTRLLTFISAQVPDILKPAYAFAGLSMSQQAMPYVQNWIRTRQSVSDIVPAFSVMVLATDMSVVVNQGGAEAINTRAAIFSMMRDNRGLMTIDKDREEFQNVSAPLGTLDHLQAQAQEQMASVSGIPLIFLLGITPSGLNATAEPEVRAFYSTIKSLQVHLFSEHLRTMIDVVQLHLFGEIDPAIGFDFPDLWELDETARTANRKTDVDSDVELINAGVLAPIEVRARVARDEASPYHGLDVDDVPDPPEAEQDPSLLSDPSRTAEPKAQERASDARFIESEHPRGQPSNKGQFGPGGGGLAEAKGFDPEQRSAVKAYTGAAYRPINALLRAGKPLSAEHETIAKGLDSAIDGNRLRVETKVFRGLPSAPTKELTESGRLKKGERFQCDEFLSSSASQEEAEKFAQVSNSNMVLHIVAPAGSRASDVAKYSDAPDEAEVLIGRGAKFVIEKWDAKRRILSVRLEHD